jgi:hypothetical protein
MFIFQHKEPHWTMKGGMLASKEKTTLLNEEEPAKEQLKSKSEKKHTFAGLPKEDEDDEQTKKEDEVQEEKNQVSLINRPKVKVTLDDYTLQHIMLKEIEEEISPLVSRKVLNVLQLTNMTPSKAKKIIKDAIKEQLIKINRNTEQYNEIFENYIHILLSLYKNFSVFNLNIIEYDIHIKKFLEKIFEGTFEFLSDEEQNKKETEIFEKYKDEKNKTESFMTMYVYLIKYTTKIINELNNEMDEIMNKIEKAKEKTPILKYIIDAIEKINDKITKTTTEKEKNDLSNEFNNYLFETFAKGEKTLNEIKEITLEAGKKANEDTKLKSKFIEVSKYKKNLFMAEYIYKELNRTKGIVEKIFNKVGSLASYFSLPTSTTAKPKETRTQLHKRLHAEFQKEALELEKAIEASKINEEEIKIVESTTKKKQTAEQKARILELKTKGEKIKKKEEETKQKIKDLENEIAEFNKAQQQTGIEHDTSPVVDVEATRKQEIKNKYPKLRITTGRLDELVSKKRNDSEFKEALENYIKTEITGFLEDKETESKDIDKLSDIIARVNKKHNSDKGIGFEMVVMNVLNTRGVRKEVGGKYISENIFYPDKSDDYYYKKCEDKAKNKLNERMGNIYDLESEKIFVECKYYRSSDLQNVQIGKNKIVGSQYYKPLYNSSREVKLQYKPSETSSWTDYDDKYRKVIFLLEVGDKLYYYDFGKDVGAGSVGKDGQFTINAKRLKGVNYIIPASFLKEIFFRNTLGAGLKENMLGTGINEEVNEDIDFNKIYLYTNQGKQILKSDNLTKLKQDIKKRIAPVKNSKKIFTVSYSFNKTKEKPLKFTVTQMTLTPKMGLNFANDDMTQTITFSRDEVKKYQFSEDYVIKIIKIAKEGKMDLSKLALPISQFLEPKEKVKEPEKEPEENQDIDFNKIYLYTNKGQQILKSNDLTKLKQDIKERIAPVSKDKKLFVVSYSFNKTRDKPLKFVVTQYTLTPKMSLIAKDGDITQSFTYTRDEVKKYQFSEDYIKKIINILSTGKQIFKEMNVSISDVLEPKKVVAVKEELKPKAVVKAQGEKYNLKSLISKLEGMDKSDKRLPALKQEIKEVENNYKKILKSIEDRMDEDTYDETFDRILEGEFEKLADFYTFINEHTTKDYIFSVANPTGDKDFKPEKKAVVKKEKKEKEEGEAKTNYDSGEFKPLPRQTLKKVYDEWQKSLSNKEMDKSEKDKLRKIYNDFYKYLIEIVKGYDLPEEKEQYIEDLIDNFSFASETALIKAIRKIKKSPIDKKIKRLREEENVLFKQVLDLDKEIREAKAMLAKSKNQNNITKLKKLISELNEDRSRMSEILIDKRAEIDKIPILKGKI